MTCSARQLLASMEPVPRARRPRPRLGVGVRGEALSIVEGWRRVNEANEAAEQSTADRGQTVVSGQLPVVATVA